METSSIKRAHLEFGKPELNFDFGFRGKGGRDRRQRGE
jgi:hypothetical protein